MTHVVEVPARRATWLVEELILATPARRYRLRYELWKLPLRGGAVRRVLFDPDLVPLDELGRPCVRTPPPDDGHTHWSKAGDWWWPPRGAHERRCLICGLDFHELDDIDRRRSSGR